MKVRLKIATLAVCIFVAAVARELSQLAVSSDQTQNLLRNPGFEAEGEWGFWHKAKGVRFERVAEGKTGRWAASITVEEDAQPSWYQWRQSIPAKVGTTYRLTGWVRTKKVHARSGAYISLSAYDDKGNCLLFSDAPRINGSHDWLKISTTLTTPEKTATILVACSLHGYGQAFFDDLTLEELLPLTEDEIEAVWQKMQSKDEWLFLPRLVGKDELALPLTANDLWKPHLPYGWLTKPPIEQQGDAFVMQVPLDAPTSATLRLSLPKGRYWIHIWAGGDANARIPMQIKCDGKVLTERLFSITAEEFRWQFTATQDFTDVTFEPSCQPIPVGDTAPSIPIKAIAITRKAGKPFRNLTDEQKRLLEATVNPIPTKLPPIGAPSIFAIHTAGQVSPEGLVDLKANEPIALSAARGEIVSGGALLLLKPNEKFLWEVKGDIPKAWLRLFTGVSGWVRMEGIQRWDFWLSPARWMEEKREGMTSSEGLGLAWLQIVVPKDAKAKTYRARVIVKAEGKVLSLPLSLSILPFTLPDLDADVGMFYNATMQLSCPDDELPRRWRMHFEDMKAHGMNSVFIYTFRMVWRKQEGRQWQWLDEALSGFLKAYREFFERPIYICTHGDRYHPQGYGAYVGHVKELAQRFGLKVFFMPSDEAYATQQRLKDAEVEVRMAREAGGKVAMTTDQTQAERLDEWLDVRVYGASFVNEAVLRHTEASRDVFALYNGGSTSDPKPAADRFFFGVYAWATKAKGVFQWAYQWGCGNPLDDRDQSSHDWCYTFPAGKDFCAPTLNWEAVREGINDWRYLVAVEKLAESDSEAAQKARKLLSEARSDVEVFLKANTYIRYRQEQSAYPYERLVACYPAQRLFRLRRDLQSVLCLAEKEGMGGK